MDAAPAAAADAGAAAAGLPFGVGWAAAAAATSSTPPSSSSSAAAAAAAAALLGDAPVLPRGAAAALPSPALQHPPAQAPQGRQGHPQAHDARGWALLLRVARAAAPLALGLGATAAEAPALLRRRVLAWVLAAVKVAVAAVALRMAQKKYLARAAPPKWKPRRVAVVGGGIAGMGAAWALRRAGVDAVVFEKRPRVGGNAKSFAWETAEKGKVETGLAVLAYPEQYFHTYVNLMEEVGMRESSLHELKYFVAEKNFRGPGPKPADGLECVFAHGREGFEPAPWLKADLAAWDRAASFARRVNAVMQPSTYASLYRSNVLNPLNVIPIRTYLRWFGVSDLFWERVFVPVHTSTFLEVELDTVPAVLTELLDDLVPFTRVPEMRAWKTNPYDVFLHMMRGWPKDAVRTSSGVERVEFTPSPSNPDMLDVWVSCDASDPAARERFDAVIFACSAPAMLEALHGAGSDPSKSALGWLARTVEALVLRNVPYTLDRDKTFEVGVVHSDAKAVFPDKFREDLLKHHCNYMEIDGNKPKSMENHFIISSWSPTAQGTTLPMLVSYNAGPKIEGVDAAWTVTSREAHPSLTMWQLISSAVVWPWLQGARNEQCFFCGSAATPGNGHDLSLLSGFVAASRLGAPYPFPANDKGATDFERLERMMVVGVL